MFITDSNIANYADNTIPYVCNRNMNDITKNIETESLTIFEWFQINFFKANSGKSQVILTTCDKLKLYVRGSLMCNETTMKFSFEPQLDTA